MVSERRGEEVLAALRPQERAWVERFRDRVRDLLGERLRDLRVFGSKVRGDDHAESDIDLLVLVEDLQHEDWEAVLDLATGIAPGVLAPKVLDYDRYHAPISRASGFYEEMRRESVRL